MTSGTTPHMTTEPTYAVAWDAPLGVVDAAGRAAWTPAGRALFAAIRAAGVNPPPLTPPPTYPAHVTWTPDPPPPPPDDPPCWPGCPVCTEDETPTDDDD